MEEQIVPMLFTSVSVGSYSIEATEEYPAFSISEHDDESIESIELTAWEYADYLATMKKYNAWQLRLKEAYKWDEDL